jgi:hypothetical protein
MKVNSLRTNAGEYIMISFRSIAEHLEQITGFSTPIFGISWQPPKLERRVIRSFIIFLEDRRVLYAPFDSEILRDVIASVQMIRSELVKMRQMLREKSEADPHLRALQIICYNLLYKVDRSLIRINEYDLRRFRKDFGIRIAKLCVLYGIDLNENSELSKTILDVYNLENTHDVSDDNQDHPPKRAMKIRKIIRKSLEWFK